MTVFIRTLLRDTLRVAALFSLSALLFFSSDHLPGMLGERSLAPLLASLAMIVAMLAVTHVLRRLLFPRLDLQALALRAAEAPIGAGLAFVGICGVLVALFFNAGMMLR